MDKQRASTVLVVVLALAACGSPSSSLPARKASADKDVAAPREAGAISQKVPDEVAAWRTCAATLHPREARQRAADDAAAGEWRFLTYKQFGLGVFDEVPGIAECAPLLPPGHDRMKQLSVCGDVVGDLSYLDCGCRRAELAYRAAYNRTLLRRVANVRPRNCAAGGRD